MNNLKIGDKVRIREGKLKGHIGIIKEMTCVYDYDPGCIINVQAAPNGVAVMRAHSLDLYDENTGKIIKRNRFEAGNKVEVCRGDYECSEGFIVEVGPSNDRGYAIMILSYRVAFLCNGSLQTHYTSEIPVRYFLF